MKLCLGPVLISAFASILMIGCTTDPAPTEEEHLEEESSEIVASCKYPRRYAALLTEGVCAPVRATRGEWVPSPAFEDAPENACVYSWVGDKKGVRIDRSTLQNWAGDRGVLTAVCGSDPNGFDPAHVQQIPELSIYGMAGSVGCDVCGTLKNNKVWIVIPPERDAFRRPEFQIPLTNGSVRTFAVQANQSAGVMSFALPPPPPGAQYVNGRFAIQ